MGVIYTPPPSETCRCEARPDVDMFHVNTIWECEVCGKRYRVGHWADRYTDTSGKVWVPFYGEVPE